MVRAWFPPLLVVIRQYICFSKLSQRGNPDHGKSGKVQITYRKPRSVHRRDLFVPDSWVGGIIQIAARSGLCVERPASLYTYKEQGQAGRTHLQPALNKRVPRLYIHVHIHRCMRPGQVSVCIDVWCPPCAKRISHQGLRQYVSSELSS
jgi:hypothetical protein